jgi:hypothetical protein
MVDALDPRHGRRRQQADCQDQKAASELAPVADLHAPKIAGFVEMCRIDLTIELHMLAQIELVGDKVEIAKIFRLAGEAFLPMPLLKQFARERIAIGVALGIETATGVAIPVPGSAEIVGGVEHRCVDPDINQALDLVDPSHARADHNYFVAEFRFLRHSLLQNSCFHSLLPYL